MYNLQAEKIAQDHHHLSNWQVTHGTGITCYLGGSCDQLLDGKVHHFLIEKVIQDGISMTDYQITRGMGLYLLSFGTKL